MSASPSDEGTPGLRGLDLPPGFDSSDDILSSFYIPALERSVSYDRSVGYFRSSALAVAARGLSHFINGDGRMRLLCGAEITAEDRDALMGRVTLDGAFASRLQERLVTADEVARRRLEVLAWLASEGRLEIRIAIAVDEGGRPLVSEPQSPYFHEKIGVLRDRVGDGVAFQGSVNESETAWTENFESFSVYTSWEGSSTHFAFWANKFEQRWSGDIRRFRVFPLPEAVRRHLISLAPAERPSYRDAEEAAAKGADGDLARFLAVAPRLVGGEGVAEATVGVQLYPHQRQVIARLAEQYPRSWLVADEVGLGKTISAGMAIRRLLLAGEVGRVLILAPANVCRQWQDEFFEKFGLWVPRLDGGKIYGAHPADVSVVPQGDNPYARHPVLIASSHLARRPEQQRLVLDAAPYDLVVVDEAHHARRQHRQDASYRPSRLLQLLDSIRDEGAAKALWLLTATPMQLSSVELLDLVRLTGLAGPLTDPESFVRYFKEIAKHDGTDWAWLDHVLRQTPRLPFGPVEVAMLHSIRERLGPVDAERVARFGSGSEPAEHLASALGPAGKIALREWLKTLSPVGQYVTRHSRETLKRYKRAGLLRENLAERTVESVPIRFSTEEQALYEALDVLLDRLMALHGTRKGAGFVLTVYRRRLTSSWHAIELTLRRRLERRDLDLEDDLVEEAEAEEGDDSLLAASGRTVDQAVALPLSDADLAEIRGYLDRIRRVSDSKLDRLRQDLDEARSAGHSTIVFTQFTDTLDYLRDSFTRVYRSQLATFTGDGGAIFRDTEGWVPISKRELVGAVRSRQVTVLLATDAASEGLNLQAASYLINYDMPWNPMRVEQRIGRIDRLGQVSDEVQVRNYFIPGTVEEAVYNALSKRIDDFTTLLGNLQPILGATERAFRAVFRAPRSERASEQAKSIDHLLNQIDELEESGLDLSVEDPLPIPEAPAALVSLKELREIVQDRFGAALDEAGKPVTWDPRRASRDAEGWAALATYGHPQIASILARRSLVSEGSPVVIAGDGPVAAVRADRTPPEPIANVREIEDLGLPTALAEAENLARQIAAGARATRQERYDRVENVRHAQWEETIRFRFKTLVRAVLVAGCAAARAEGGSAQPIAIWYDLRHDTGGLQYAEAFMVRLGINLRDLIPAEVGSELMTPAAWAEIRRSSGRELVALMKTFRDRSVRSAS